jgi:hypothetical protein
MHLGFSSKLAASFTLNIYIGIETIEEKICEFSSDTGRCSLALIATSSASAHIFSIIYQKLIH